MKDRICDCGCGYEIGSQEFIRLHIESKEEQVQREATEQYDAERQASRELQEEIESSKHSSVCGCVECN